MAKERTVEVPDIGDFDQVEVIEVLVSVGDEVSVEQSLITLESDKATMEIPAPFAGVVKEVTLAVGDQVSQGARIVLLEVADDAEAEEAPAEPPAATAAATSFVRLHFLKTRPMTTYVIYDLQTF